MVSMAPQCIVCDAEDVETLSFCGHAAMCTSCTREFCEASPEASLRCPMCRAPVIAVPGGDAAARAASLYFGHINDVDKKFVGAVRAAAEAEKDSGKKRRLEFIEDMAKNKLAKWADDPVPSLVMRDAMVSSWENEKVAAMVKMVALLGRCIKPKDPVVGEALQTKVGKMVLRRISFPVMDKRFSASNLGAAVSAIAEGSDEPSHLRIMAACSHTAEGDALFERVLKREHDVESITALAKYAFSMQKDVEAEMLSRMSMATHGTLNAPKFEVADEEADHYPGHRCMQFGGCVYKLAVARGGVPVFDQNGFTSRFEGVNIVVKVVQ